MLHIKLKQGDVLLIDDVAVVCKGPLAKLAIRGGTAIKRVYGCTTLEEIDAARTTQKEQNDISKRD